MKKHLLMTGILLVNLMVLQAQSGLKYDYDNNGNRISRRVAAISSLAPAFKDGIEQAVSQENTGSQTIAIYPNPTKGLFSIGITGLDSSKENYYLLYDIQGKLLKHERITSDRTSVDITWDGAGMYLLDISLGGNVTRWKIVKQ